MAILGQRIFKGRQHSDSRIFPKCHCLVEFSSLFAHNSSKGNFHCIFCTSEVVLSFDDELGVKWKRQIIRASVLLVCISYPSETDWNDPFIS